MLAHDFPALPAHIPSDYAFKFKHKLPTPQGPLYVWHGTKFSKVLDIVTFL
jgi:hypothetical protein